MRASVAILEENREVVDESLFEKIKAKKLQQLEGGAAKSVPQRTGGGIFERPQTKKSKARPMANAEEDRRESEGGPTAELLGPPPPPPPPEVHSEPLLPVPPPPPPPPPSLPTEDPIPRPLSTGGASDPVPSNPAPPHHNFSGPGAASSGGDEGGGDDAKYPDAWKAIHSACRWGKAELVSALLARPANLSLADPANGNRPLHIAAQNGHLTIATLLLNFGAAPDVPNDGGQTALHMVLRPFQRMSIASLLLMRETFEKKSVCFSPSFLSFFLSFFL